MFYGAMSAIGFILMILVNNSAVNVFTIDLSQMNSLTSAPSSPAPPGGG